MRFNRLLALLLAAALALAVLVGCGSGQQSAAQALLKLLDGKYPNISIEIDPDLEADLRQAISQAEAENAGDDDAVIRAALEKLVGSTVTFRNLGDGQQGDTTFDLVFYAGTDPDKAAQAAYSQWNIVFANVPDDGQYDTSLAMVETNSGIWMLVKATVEKAGTVDKPDTDNDEPEQPEANIVKGTGFSYDVDNNQVTISKAVGLEELFSGTGTVTGDADALKTARADGFDNVVITLDAGTEYTVSQQLAADFKGTLKGESENNKAQITLSGGAGLFGTIADGGEVSNLDITVTKDINVSKTDNSAANAGAYAGGIVGKNETGGHISGCEVTVNSTISAERSGSNSAYAGGIAGYNLGTIDGSCTVEVTDTIKATGKESGSAFVGGIAGCIDYVTSITSCSVTLEGSGTIQAITSTTNDYLGNARAGGMVGIITIYNTSNPLTYGPATGTGSITATAGKHHVTLTVTADSTSDFASQGKAYAGTTCGMLLNNP